MPFTPSQLPGYLKFTCEKNAAELDMPPHGLMHDHNEEFYLAMLEVVEVLRAEALVRECHGIHEKLVDMQKYIKERHCQDFVATLYPASLAN